MIRSDLARRVLLGLTAAVFVAIAARGVLAPAQMAAGLGYSLSAPNGYSEFYAIYLGLWLATAALAILAAVRIRQPQLGDLLALLVLAQPVGRLYAAALYGLPQGPLLAIFGLELIGGLLVLGVRPSRST